MRAQPGSSSGNEPNRVVLVGTEYRAAMDAEPQRASVERRSTSHHDGPWSAAARSVRIANRQHRSPGLDDVPGSLRAEAPALMPLFRRHHESDAARYRMHEKLFAIGDDFWIENEQGDKAFKVNGKALRMRDTLVLEDPSGVELFKVQEKALRVRDTMKIERDGETVATVKKALIHPLRDRFAIEVEGGDDLEAKGNIVDHEYKIERDGDHLAEVSKRWFRVRDTYGIEIATGENDALLLAVVVCIDQMSHG